MHPKNQYEPNFPYRKTQFEWKKNPFAIKGGFGERIRFSSVVVDKYGVYSDRGECKHEKGESVLLEFGWV